MTAFVVALDVGGTGMKGGLVDQAGTVRHAEHRPTPRAEGPARVTEAVRAFIADLAEAGGGAPAGVGLAVPGLVTAQTVVYSANLGWREVPAAVLSPLQVPVRLGHDVRAAGLAEAVLGAGRGAGDFLFLSLGTGISGAQVLHGVPYGGTLGWGGEIGHIPVHPGGEPCACGQPGCLETYASAAAVARRYAARRGGDGEVSAKEVVARAATDPVAARVWAEAVDALSLALATYTLLLDPALIVIGGGLSPAGAALLDPLAGRLTARLSFRPAPPLATAALGTRAGLLGAALLGWQAAGVPDAGAAWTMDVPSSTGVP